MGAKRPRNDSAARRGNGFLGGRITFRGAGVTFGAVEEQNAREGGMIGASKGREGVAADKRRGGTI